MMKIFLIIVVVGNLLGTQALQAGDTGILTNVVERVVQEGKKANMNGGFAKFLQITDTRSPIPMKRVIVPDSSETNDFYVSIPDKKIIVIVDRKIPLETFYLTDLSGELKRAVVNNPNVDVGGITNIPVAEAEADFQNRMKWWGDFYKIKKDSE